MTKKITNKKLALLSILLFGITIPELASANYQFRAYLSAAMGGHREAPATEGLAPNGITITCKGRPDGEEFEVNGKLYRTVYSKLDAWRYPTTACTSNVTDMSYY